MTVTQWVDYFFKSQKIVCNLYISKINIQSPVRERLINLSPRTIGVCVDYLTRLVLENDFSAAFKTVRKGLIAFTGLEREEFDELVRINFAKESFEEAYLEFEEQGKLYEYWVANFKKHNSQLTDVFIRDVVRLLKYDTFYRSSKLINNNVPSKSTIEYIRSLVYISANYLNSKHKQIQFGGDISVRTEKIHIGDWDYLSQESLIDMKVSKYNPLLKNWVQLIVYYLLGLEAKDEKFLRIKYLEIINPKLCAVYKLDIKDIPSSLIQTIRTQYGKILLPKNHSSFLQ